MDFFTQVSNLILQSTFYISKNCIYKGDSNGAKMPFRTVGTMLDYSRNAVPNIDSERGLCAESWALTSGGHGNDETRKLDLSL